MSKVLTFSRNENFSSSFVFLAFRGSGFICVGAFIDCLILEVSLVISFRAFLASFIWVFDFSELLNFWGFWNSLNFCNFCSSQAISVKIQDPFSFHRFRRTSGFLL